MKHVPIYSRKGVVGSTLVDDCDYETASLFRWYLHNDGYAIYTAPDGKSTRLHRLITECPKGMTVDHINGDKLDNRRANLRICTDRDNNLNRLRQRNNRSGYKGVYRDLRSGMYIAQIKRNRKRYRFGPFVLPEDAYDAYCKAAHALHGEYANTSNELLTSS